MADNATAAVRALTRRLLAHEAGRVKRTEGTLPSSFRVCEKLREPLGGLMGTSGFRSLLVRSIALAGAKTPWVLVLRVSLDGTLIGLDQVPTSISARSFDQGEAAVTAEFLGLLVAFIGQTLTLRLLHDIYPKLDEAGF